MRDKCRAPLALQRSRMPIALIIALTLLLDGCDLFVEAQFEHRKGPIAPVWLDATLVHVYQSMTLTVYTSGKVSIEVFDPAGRTIGSLRGEIQMYPTADERGGLCFPRYFYVVAMGASQLFEQRGLEPYVYTVEQASEVCVPLCDPRKQVCG